MIKSIFTLRRPSLIGFLLSMLIAVGIAWPCQQLLGLTPRLQLILTVCLASELVFLLFDALPKLHFLVYPLLTAAMVFCIFPYRTMSESFFSALVLFVNGETIALTVWSYPLTILLSLIASGFGSAIGYSDNPFPYTVFFLILLFFPIALGIGGASAAALLPLLTAALLSTREHGTSAAGILIPSAAVLGLTLLLSQLIPETSVPVMADQAQQVRQAIDDYLFFTDARTPFTLSTTGWQPLGANRLGGAAQPADEKVMQIMTPGTVYLRGAIRNEYNGFAWADTIGGRRYLYVDPRFAVLRRNLFDQGRPSTSLSALFPESTLVRVYLEHDATSTLYLTQRFGSLSGQNLVPYFSPASEVFATHTLTAGEQYDFTAVPLTADSEGIRDLVLSAASSQDSWMEDSIMESYLSLPSIIESDVYSLAASITENARTDYDRALALCTYLQTHFPYTLNQSTPPTTRDFVSWFLFEEKKGYCTSFASAMTVMARTLGLPARYIEGYIAAPESSGIAYVTQEHAHAWCEVYFKGFGWLTFDPTPGANSAGGGDGSGSGSSLPTPSPSPSPTPAPTPEQDAPSPTPQSDSQTPTPQPENGDTPTPPPTASPTPVPTPEPTPAPNDQDRKPPILTLLLILLLLAVLLILRFYLSAPSQAARRQRSSNDILLIWYAAILQILHACRIDPLPGEAPATFLERAEGLLRKPVSLKEVGRALCTAGYSPKRPSAKMIERAAKTYRLLLRQASPAARLRLIGIRFVHGLSLKNIQ